MNYKEMYKVLLRNKIYTSNIFENSISIEVSINRNNDLVVMLYVGNTLYISRSIWHQDYSYNDFVNLIKDLLNQVFDNFKKDLLN